VSAAARRLRDHLLLVYADDRAIRAAAASLRDDSAPGEVALVAELVARALAARTEAPP
jgi:hypothetical protein